MLAGLMVLAFGLGVLAVAADRRTLGLGDSLREVLLVACPLGGTLLVAFTELASLGGQFRFYPMLACWLVTSVFLGAWVVRRRQALRGWLHLDMTLGWGDGALLAVCVLLVGATGLCAVLGPPNNGDAMIYHLPRQLRWIQQGSVAHFPTIYAHLIVFPPFAEFVGAHALLLAGTDHAANLVQWAALVLTMLVASLLARDLGQGRRGQLLAALFVVALPMAYLQSFNAKNDLVVSLWLCSSAWWAVRLWNGHALTWPHTAVFGLTLGLLLLTKATGCLYAVPVAVVAGVAMLRHARRVWWQAGLIGAAVLALNVGHWARNYQHFGSPFGPTEMRTMHNNETFAPAAVASNALRNGSLHLGLPSTAWNRAVQRAVESGHARLGIDCLDPRTSFIPEACPFVVAYAPDDEDRATAPAHAALLLLAAALLPLALFRRRLPLPVAAFLAIPLGCSLLFCVVLKWQPWHGRLLLPVFCLGCVALCLLLPRRFGSWTTAAAVLLCLAALAPPAYQCRTRSLFGPASVLRGDRAASRFVYCEHWKAATHQLADRLATLAPRTIGLCGVGGQREYLIERVILDRAAPERPAFAHVPLPGQPVYGGTAGARHLDPDVVVCLHSMAPTLRHPLTSSEYTAIAQVPPFTVYARAGTAPAMPLDPTQFPFLGWTAGDGWLDFEGPHPGLGMVRWCLQPRAHLYLPNGAQPCRLVGACYGNHQAGQTFCLRYDGREVYRHTFGGGLELHEFDVLLPAGAGGNVVEVEAVSPAAGGSPDRGLLFTRLLVSPVPIATEVGTTISVP